MFLYNEAQIMARLPENHCLRKASLQFTFLDVLETSPGSLARLINCIHDPSSSHQRFAVTQRRGFCISSPREQRTGACWGRMKSRGRSSLRDLKSEENGSTRRLLPLPSVSVSHSSRGSYVTLNKKGFETTTLSVTSKSTLDAGSLLSAISHEDPSALLIFVQEFEGRLLGGRRRQEPEMFQDEMCLNHWFHFLTCHTNPLWLVSLLSQRESELF